AGTSTIVLVTTGTSARFFDLTGSSFIERFGGRNLLTYDALTDQYRLVDENGDLLQFAGFSETRLYATRGQFLSFSDAGGNLIEVTAQTTLGDIAELQRTDSVSGITQSLLLTYNDYGPGAGNISGVLLRDRAGGSWTTRRRVLYEYYDSTTNFG